MSALITGYHTKSEAKGQAGTFTDHSDATLDANGAVLYGMDKELAEKAAAKYDPQLEARCRQWLETLTGTPLEGSLQEALKDGVALVTAVNTIRPGICAKASTSKMAFKQMENIANYLDACTKLGVPKFSLFQTVALYENKDMLAVLTNIQALGSAAQKEAGYAGPVFGVKLAESNVREFTAEQLAAGKAEQTFLGKGSTGTAGSVMGAHIDHSKDINKMQHVVGEMGNLGFDGTSTLVGNGSHGTAGSLMGSHIDHSKNIDKMSCVRGADGLGRDGAVPALGMGSHGQAGTADAFQVDSRKDINRMAKVH